MSSANNLSFSSASITPEQQESFKEAAKPLMAWLSSNIHPNAIVVVDSTSAILHEGLIQFSTKEFVRD